MGSPAVSDIVSLTPLNLPPIQARFRSNNQRLEIYDAVRKMYVALTPEEWVRQHCIAWLNSHHGYLLSRCSVEKQVAAGKRSRYDVLWYSRAIKPFLLIECKAPSVDISKDTLLQAARYNVTMHANHLMLTNGLHTFCGDIQHDGTVVPLISVPDYE